ncbi:MAG: hypothetical protein OEM26_11070 [Saprospiraceae bacterium]|nr:hypothetical protein [Saprospiraceae bacterium]
MFRIATFLFLLSLLAISDLQGHPSSGLIITQEGDLIFADVLRNEGTIWKYSPDGRLTALLTGEHCHFVF